MSQQSLPPKNVGVGTPFNLFTPFQAAMKLPGAVFSALAPKGSMNRVAPACPPGSIRNAYGQCVQNLRQGVSPATQGGSHPNHPSRYVNGPVGQGAPRALIDPVGNFMRSGANAVRGMFAPRMGRRVTYPAVFDANRARYACPPGWVLYNDGIGGMWCLTQAVYANMQRGIPNLDPTQAYRLP